MKSLFLIFVNCLILSPTCFALYENFEDGDYASNPEWTLTNSSGSDSIVQDSLRPDNKVLAMLGTSSAHRRIASSVNFGFPDARFEVDFMASTTHFSPIFSLTMENGDNLRNRIEYDGINTTWSLLHNAYNGPDWASREPNPVVISSQPTQEWWSISMWYDGGTSQVISEIRKVSDGSLIKSRSYDLPTGFENNTINEISIEVARLDWQYVDNVMLVPEPSTLLLFGLSGVFYFRRRIQS